MLHLVGRDIGQRDFVGHDKTTEEEVFPKCFPYRVNVSPFVGFTGQRDSRHHVIHPLFRRDTR